MPVMIFLICNLAFTDHDLTKPYSFSGTALASHLLVRASACIVDPIAAARRYVKFGIVVEAKNEGVIAGMRLLWPRKGKAKAKTTPSMCRGRQVTPYQSSLRAQSGSLRTDAAGG